MQANPLISSFNSGEISPRLYGRSDLEFYGNACKELFNTVCLPSGAADKRPGSRHVVAAKTEASAVVVIPFEFKTEQAYMIEGGDLYFRYCKNKAQLLDGPPVETVSPYAAADLAGLKWTQSLDVLYLVHPDYAPRKLERASETSWSITQIDFIDGPYFDENPVDTDLLALSGGAPWTKGSSLTLTASGGHTPFVAGHVGALWRLTSGADFAWVKVTAFTSSAVVTVETQVDVPISLQATTTNAWREGLWSDYRGYPSCVTFHDQRLCFGGAGGQPWRVDASASNLYETMTPGTADGDAIAVVLATGRANGIFWLVSEEFLYAGTSGGVQRIGPESATWTPDNTPREKVEASAAGDVQPVEAVTDILFVGRHFKRLRAMGYQLEADGQVARDATLRADHIAKAGIVELAWQEFPWQICWARRADGALLGLTFMPDQKVEGWHRHLVGGAFGAGGAIVESIAVIPGAANDELWMVVKRTIDGATRRYIEVLEDWRTDETAQADEFFVDSGLDYSGAPATVISGLGHLEGQTARIWADGGPVPDQVVTGGQITLAVAASRVIVGLGYDPRIVPMPPEPGSARGTAAGRLKRIVGLGLRLWRCGSVQVGTDDANLDTLQLNEGQLLGDPPDLWSGVKNVTPPSQWGREADMLITHDQAGPLTVTALMPEMETSE